MQTVEGTVQKLCGQKSVPMGIGQLIQIQDTDVSFRENYNIGQQIGEYKCVFRFMIYGVNDVTVPV